MQIEVYLVEHGIGFASIKGSTVAEINITGYAPKVAAGF